MKKKMVTLLCAAVMVSSLVAGCGENTEKESDSSALEETTEETGKEEEEADNEDASDQEKADEVAALIDAIYEIGRAHV